MGKVEWGHLAMQRPTQHSESNVSTPCPGHTSTDDLGSTGTSVATSTHKLFTAERSVSDLRWSQLLSSSTARTPARVSGIWLQSIAT